MATHQTPGPQTPESSRLDYVGRSGIYPISGPWPAGDALIVGQGDLGHPEQQHRWLSIRRRAGNQLLVGSGVLALLGGLSLFTRQPKVGRVLGTLLLLTGGAGLLAGSTSSLTFSARR